MNAKKKENKTARNKTNRMTAAAAASPAAAETAAELGAVIPAEAETPASFRRKIEVYLKNRLHVTFEQADVQDLYKATAFVVNTQLLEKRVAFNDRRMEIENRTQGRKKIYYICMEFLVGQSLKNNLYNLGETQLAEELMQEKGIAMQDLYDCEPDAGLGNGGLGRLAACFMDALATGGYDATGFSLRYEYGLFRQKIVDGWQVELPDNWLPGGRVWLNPHEDDTFYVHFYGRYSEYWEDGRMRYHLDDAQKVEAVPYDLYISGADSEAVSKLRLWRARDSEDFDMGLFNNGDFTRAAQKNNSAELITKVLYPADNIEEGKELRLKQQYFMVSASCQNIVRDHYNQFGTLSNFGEKTVIHINDTHPALTIPELMRIFLDDYGYDWDHAWKIITSTVSYTNHTVLAEALEKWNADLVRTMMPRIFAIICEIDRRFRIAANEKFPGDKGKIDYMAILGDKQVRMANLSVIGSHRVNGVSALHSRILRDDLFHDHFLMTPYKFANVTNGIAYRRWLCQSNPQLAALIDDCIGPDYRLHPERLEDFIHFRGDSGVQERLEKIKRGSKARLADRIRRDRGIEIDPDSLFIVQAKRLHEYKRQLMNAMRIIARYLDLKENPNKVTRPETYLFAAKAAPSYYLAKEIIDLIWKLGEEIENDPVISKKMKVVFLENYSVSMAEMLMPATEISEQISLAGKEASGTGNMKMMINGAVTIGTLDGANVEIREAVGPDSIYIFGLNEEEVRQEVQNGYHAEQLYNTDATLRRVIDAIGRGFAGRDFNKLRDYLLQPSYSIADPYMCLRDFEDYCRVHDQMQADYEDRSRWNTMSIDNIAKAARFAADRSIRDYAEKIWYTKPVLSSVR
ncbi:MAG: glycogen/starch/alpha-glucan phosphorylase [Anaerovoracaceae bacterium]|jgi:starch phosphorylase